MKALPQINTIRTLRKSDPNFMIRSGMVLSPRAGFEISIGCPKEYRDIIQQCISNGLLMPIAFVNDEELMWDKLRG